MSDLQKHKATAEDKKSGLHVSVAKGKPRMHVGTDDDESKKKARQGAKFLALVVVAYLVFLVVTGQMASFIDALSNVDHGWVFGACICFVFYFIFGVAAYAIAVWLDPDSPVGVRDLMSVEASGIFFGNLTPMMAGAVPAQIVRLTRTGLDAGEASATQFTRFIMFQFGVVLFAVLALAAKLDYFFATYGDIIVLNLIVFGVHFVELIVLFAMCLWPGFVKGIGNWALRFVKHHGWMKDTSKWDETINVQVDEFSAAFKRAARHLPSMGLTLLVTMLQLAALYMIPWFVLRAFGQNADFWECLAAGSMVQMVASAVPLPGGTGGAESGFALFYGPHFGATATAGYLIWRIVTFFGPTLIAAPLLGMRSDNSESIRRRWDRLVMRRRTGGQQVIVAGKGAKAADAKGNKAAKLADAHPHGGARTKHVGLGMSGAVAAKLAAGRKAELEGHAGGAEGADGGSSRQEKDAKRKPIIKVGTHIVGGDTTFTSNAKSRRKRP